VSEARIMERLTVRQIREYLASRRDILVPIGSNEQHGYHLPLCTDTVVAREISRQVGGRTGTLVAPAISFTFSGGGLPGTINVSPAVMSLLVQDVLGSLALQGFRQFYLVLAHGGSENLTALGDALKLLLRTNPQFAEALVALFPVWKFDARGIGWRKAFAEGDWHAGWLETSLMLALAPELVRLQDLELDPPELLELQIAHPDNYQRAEKIVDDPLVVARLSQRPDIRVGVMGRPEKASAELGKRIAAAMVEEMAARLQAIRAQARGGYREVAFQPPPIIIREEST
jgi:creatinine amidohydrolase/Fe(II)-dependent formamide hydrolase-like protein